jgi:MGT family glycosyltransferase
MPMAGAAFQAAMEALGALPVRGLLTVGHVTDRDALPAPPANVEIEAWVPQAEALAHARAVISHGGSGSTVGALAAGVPMVVVPLFADQFLNAGRVAATGAGLVAEPEAEQIRGALSQVLEDDRFAHGAQALAAEMREQPSADEAVGLFSELS